MVNAHYNIIGKKVIIRIKDRICEDEEELISSALFREILIQAIERFAKSNLPLYLKLFQNAPDEKTIDRLIQTLIFLQKVPINHVAAIVEKSSQFLDHPDAFNDFVEFTYNHWRSFDRFIICNSEGDSLDKRPFRTFNDTIEKLTHLIRKTYRDVQENISGEHPRIYRQVIAGAEIATIALPEEIPFSGTCYQKLLSIPVIRQILIYPPLILYPPMNKRSGKFEKIEINPLSLIDLKENDYLCYPAKVGKLLVYAYFHIKFFELGFSLCNLFELANDEDLKRKPDAVYIFGAEQDLSCLGKYQTVFYDDKDNDILVAACPNSDEFGYFGYLKKMMLTLHNAKVIKEGLFPFHGALISIMLKNKKYSLLIIGDTGAGKSETLEAFRNIGHEEIRNIDIIADDMGSLEINPKGEIIGYGTEIGAFLRIDDLQSGYTFGQMDRVIIMNPNQINARIILPVTTYPTLMSGTPIDFVLYANNYEEVDDEHPLIEQFTSPEEALSIFAAGAVMSKGTTTSTGIVHSYFANVFGPPQYKDLHEKIAHAYFQAFFAKGIYVGQIRTRLGIPGFEQKGPEETARALLKLLQESS